MEECQTPLLDKHKTMLDKTFTLDIERGDDNEKDKDIERRLKVISATNAMEKSVKEMEKGNIEAAKTHLRSISTDDPILARAMNVAEQSMEEVISHTRGVKHGVKIWCRQVGVQATTTVMSPLHLSLPLPLLMARSLVHACHAMCACENPLHLCLQTSVRVSVFRAVLKTTTIHLTACSLVRSFVRCCVDGVVCVKAVD